MSEFQVTRLLGYWLSSTKIIFEDRSSKFSSKIIIRDFLVPYDLTEFMKLAGTSKKWNDKILSVKNVQINNIILKSQINQKSSKIHFFKVLYNFSSKFIFDLKLKKSEIFRYILKGFIPIKSKWIRTEKKIIPSKKLRKELFNHLIENEIQEDFAKFLSLTMPLVYLEGFDFFYNFFNKKKPLNLVTSYSHFYSTEFQFMMSINKNTFLTIYEHGTESLNKINKTYNYEYSICNIFYGTSRLKEKLFSNYFFKAKTYPKYRLSKSFVEKCLVVNVTMPKYLTDIRSMPSSLDFKDYMESVNQYSKCLSLFYHVNHKNYPKKEGWSADELKMFGLYGEEKRNLKKSMKDYSLIVVTYPGSLFFDILIQNLKIILCWDYEKYPLSDYELEQQLILNNILFKTPKELNNYFLENNFKDIGNTNNEFKNFLIENYK